MWKFPKFSAHAFGARKVKFSFGRDVRKNERFFSGWFWCILTFVCVLRTFWADIGAFFQGLHVKISKTILLAPSALANYEFLLNGMRAESVQLLRGNLAAFSLSCFWALWAHSWVLPQVKCVPLQTLQHAPSALSKSNSNFGHNPCWKSAVWGGDSLHFGYRVCFATFEYQLWYFRLCCFSKR